MKPTFKKADRKDWVISLSLLALSVWLILSGCTTAHKINHLQKSNPQDYELHSLCESWYICKENPDNNTPGEQRKARKAIINHLNK